MIDQSIGQVPFLIMYNKKDLTDKTLSQEDLN